MTNQSTIELKGPVSGLIKQHGLVAINQNLRSVVCRAIAASNFFLKHNGYYVNSFSYSTNDYKEGPSVKIQVSRLMGELVCIIEKRVEVSDKDNRKLLIRHLNNHHPIGGIPRETHTTFVDDDFNALVKELGDSTVATMKSLALLYENTK